MKVLALAVSACALSLTGRVIAAPDAISPPQAHYRLSNGLDVLIEENHREPHVAVMVAYDIGGRDEPEGHASLAHLVEHLTFRRSRHLKDYAGLELLERAGAERVNGETHRDRTVYYSVVPAKALPLALFVESERMGFTLEAFDEPAVAHERTVVSAERESMQTGRDRLLTHMVTAVYGERHPYATRAEADDDLDEQTLRDAQWFFQRGYRPDNAHLVIVGDVTLADGRVLAERYFGGLVNPARPLSPRAPLTPAHSTGGHLVYRSSQSSAYFVAAYRAPPPASRAHLAAEVLAQSLRLRLRRQLVDQRRLAVGLRLALIDSAVDSQFVLEIIPSKEVDVDTLQAAVRTAFAEVPTHLADDLREARASLREWEWLTMENPLARAREHVQALATEGRPCDAQARAHAVLELTEAELTPLLVNFRVPLVTGQMIYDPRAGVLGRAELMRP